MADILIIDDDKVICEIVTKMMEKTGHIAKSAHTGGDGVELAQNGLFDIVFLDVNLPDVNGLDVIAAIKNSPSSPEVIIITGETAPVGAEMAILCGAWNYLEKPFLGQEINLQVSRALQFRKEKGKISTPGVLKRNGIVGDSKVIKTCLEKVTAAAYSDAPVLISGESGTGKELFARTIHLNSDRSEKPFVVFDCASVNRRSAKSRFLFGDAADASGRLDNKPGLLQQADKGTLFIDDITRLSKDLQQVLLRAMEQEKFQPVDGGKEISLNIRIIATAGSAERNFENQKAVLPALAEKFDRHLIDLPPLKDREQDCVKIALESVDQFCMSHVLDSKGVSPEFIDIITAYPWPGNVTELINAVDKAVALARNESMLYSIHLPAYISSKVIKTILLQKKKEETVPEQAISAGGFPPLKVFMETSEKQYLTMILTHAGGSVKTACSIAGISLSTMYARLRKYGMS